MLGDPLNLQCHLGIHVDELLGYSHLKLTNLTQIEHNVLYPVLDEFQGSTTNSYPLQQYAMQAHFWLFITHLRECEGDPMCVCII